MFNRRLLIIFLLFSILFAAMSARLLQLQVFAHQDYLAQVEEIMLRPPVLLPSVRGRILDRRGMLLADNRPSFTIGIHYGAISLDEKYIRRVAKNRARRQLQLRRRAKEEELEPFIRQVKSQIEDMWLQLPSWIPLPAELADKPYGNEEEEDEAKSKFLENRRAETIATVQRWRAHTKTKLQRREQQLQAERANWLQEAQLRAISRQIASLVLREEKSFIPIIFGLDNDRARRIQVGLDSPEWLTVIPTSSRVHPYGYVASQTIGSVGPVRDFDPLYLAHPLKDAVQDDPYRGYALKNDEVGRQGVERGYDWQILRGSRGLQQKDRLGKLVPGGNWAPRAGKDLQLTIDIELQKDLELAMPTDSPGAAVVIDIETGGVLALVSTPLHPRPDSKPPITVVADKSWMNRAVEGIYPPGSIVKPLVILASLSDPDGDGLPLITDQTVYTCPTEEFGKPRCRGHSHYDIGPAEAITRSCNVYCAFVGELLNSSLLMWFENAGLARPSSLGLPREQTGSLPGLTSSRYGVLRRLLAAEARQIAIGQGKVAVTPLQVANMMATLARRGKFLPTTINLEEARDEEARGSRTVDLQLDRENIKLVIEAMEGVVHEPGGTAYRISELRETGLRIAGKTGTAEYRRGLKDWRCWFAGFTRADQPQVAFAVLIEHGDSGARVAGPVAARLLELCVKHGYIKTSYGSDLSLQSR